VPATGGEARGAVPRVGSPRVVRALSARVEGRREGGRPRILVET
jgi:hypothetical protein